MCCGNRVAAQRAATATTTWVVTHGDGRVETKISEISAKLAVARSPGATWEKVVR